MNQFQMQIMHLNGELKRAHDQIAHMGQMMKGQKLFEDLICAGVNGMGGLDVEPDQIAERAISIADAVVKKLSTPPVSSVSEAPSAIEQEKDISLVDLK